MASIAGGRWHNSVSVLCNRLSLKRVRVPSYKSVFATASTVCPWKVYVFKAANLFVPERCTFSKLRICVCNCKHSLSLKGVRFQSCECVCLWKVYVFKAANVFVSERCTFSKLRICVCNCKRSLSLKGVRFQSCECVCHWKDLRFQSCESVFATASMHSWSLKGVRFQSCESVFVIERITFSKLRICVCNCKHSLSFKGACFQSCESVCPWKVYVFKAANLYLQLQACTVCPQKGVRFQSYESVLTTASMLLCSDEFTFAKVKYGLSCDTVK